MALLAHIVVADPGELIDGIVGDLHDVILSMCARLYGKRAAANKAARALAEVTR
jgi:predicted site-specific integrase-resolvase